MSWILAVETTRHKNVGTLLRCASAFGARCVVIVGSPQYSTHGAHGAQTHVEVVHFYYWRECLDFCGQMGCTVYGISPRALTLGPVSQLLEVTEPASSSESGIGSECAELDVLASEPQSEASPAPIFASIASVSVDTFAFAGPACFIVGEKTGLTQEQVAISHTVLHVTVPVAALEESIPYDTKVALCLQRYAAAVGLAESSHSGEKHLLAPRDHMRGAFIKAGRANAKKPEEGGGEGRDCGVGAEDLSLMGLSFMLSEDQTEGTEGTEAES
jgi:hypothetical protein